MVWGGGVVKRKNNQIIFVANQYDLCSSEFIWFEIATEVIVLFVNLYLLTIS